MRKEKAPVTPATRWLKQEKVAYSVHLYSYEEHGGTQVSALSLGVSEHQVIKTLVMEDDRLQPLIVLMHGDKDVSTKTLARTIGVKNVSLCSTDKAFKYTGYQFGGTSPFATRQSMPVYMEKSIGELPKIYINGGKRGFLIGLDPHVVVNLLKPIMVQVGITK